MAEELYISKTRTLPPAEDFQFLRSEGLKYIENLASKLWTDYNVHDPGITILEALCYAITELGYRTGFDVKDLLAGTDGDTGFHQAFFTAKEILTTEPVNVEDYRKLLTDIAGIHNAWMIPKANVDELEATDPVPETEVAMYPLCAEDKLIYKQTDHEPIDVRGLYNILLDLDESNEFGDLNSGNIVYTFTTNELRGVQIEAIFDRWDSANIPDLNEIFANTTPVPVKSYAVVYKDGVWDVTVKYKLAQGEVSFKYWVVLALQQKIANIESEIEKSLVKGLHEILFKRYYDKIRRTIGLINEVRRKYSAHRFLCEDLCKIDTVVPVEIGFCADIEVKPDADIEQVLAEVYFNVGEYFHPDIRFYSLSEMVDKGIPTEDIFEGPKLEHGFIDTGELKKTQLRTEIRVSDLINLVMDIPGVLAVKNVALTCYDNRGKAILPSQKWCVHLKENNKPILNTQRSKVLFFKDRLPFRAKAEETADILAALKGASDKPKLRGHAKDIPVPKGTFYQLNEYYSVQNEFPQAYGISKWGLPNNVTPERKAQALQLRAYLMFYDQLLANFFSQLYNAKNLFSLDATVTQTYFSQYLSDIKDIDSIYKSVIDADTGKDVTLSEALNPELAVPKDISNDNQHHILVESQDTFYDRRNRFLDHLLARFSESFTDYVLMLYTSSGQGKQKNKNKLIKDKITFLQEYPAISSGRGKAFDYLGDTWDDIKGNVSGLEKRVARLTGIENYNYRNLFCMADIVINTEVVDGKNKYTFTAAGSTNDLVSICQYDSYQVAETMVNKVYEHISVKERYTVDDKTPAKLYVQLRDDNGCIIAKSKSFFTKDTTAQAFIDDILLKYTAACDGEGMYLVEHLLLRPYFKAKPEAPATDEDTYKLLQVCLGKDCDFCGNEDPYSFRVSVLLPFWPERFKNMDFRRYFEKTIRTEAPAHISLKICWISFTSMKRFQELFKAWLEALKNYKRNIIADNNKKDALRKAANDLVTFLADIHSEYPEARLHDCDTGVTNPVMLGSTVLGTF